MAHDPLEYHDVIVCPYCGYRERDSWEVDFGSNEMTEVSCGECGRDFPVMRLVDVSYRSWPAGLEAA